MDILFITLLILAGLLFLTFGFSILVLKYLKGSKLYYFVKKHLITDDDLES
jgi:hypothetical protein